MNKRILAFTLTFMMLFSLISCFGGDESELPESTAPETVTKNEVPLFDEKGTMLCDYYVLNVLINGVKTDPAGGYKYVVHRYRQIGDLNWWKDCVSYTEKIEAFDNSLDHAMAIYSSFGANEESISFGYYGVPQGGATALKIINHSELKNGGVTSTDGFPYFCAEVIKIKKNSIIVSPLEGAIENYISDTLSVSRNTTGLGITADELSVGDRIRIFYDGGIFKDGINIRGTDHFELLTTDEHGFTVSFLGITSYKDVPAYEEVENGTEFTDGTVPGALPIRIVTSAPELAAEKGTNSNSYYLISNNFKYLTDNYTNEYFATNALIIAYLPSPSMSYTYEIKTLNIEDGKLTLRIAESNAPKVPYPQTLLYAVCIEVDAKTSSSLTSFDVELIN